MQVLSSAATFKINNDEMPWQAAPESDCLSQSLPERLGSGRSHLYPLEADFNLIETHFVPAQNFAIFNRFVSDEPRMVLTLGLKGRSGFEGRQGDQIVFKAGASTLTAFHASEGWRRYESTASVHQLRFTMTKSWVEQHFGEGVFAGFFDKNTAQTVAQRPISQAALQLAHCMNKNAADAHTNPLFKRGLAMAIVASELGELITELRQGPTRFTAKDQRLAGLAREILLAEYAEPPTLEQLSRRIGTNPFKLKQLFRQYFANTPYGMLLDIRMEKAHSLLTTGKYSVGVVAEMVGYGHASNFSMAFTKYFGFPPKNVSRGN